VPSSVTSSSSTSPRFDIDWLRELSKFNPDDCCGDYDAPDDDDDNAGGKPGDRSGGDDALDDNDDDGGGILPGEKKRVRPGEGFYYQSDAEEAILDDIFDEDYQEKHFSSIPNEPHYECSRNRILGGPQLDPNAQSNEKRRYLAERKKFTDKT
jgi:hypothetical protein